MILIVLIMLLVFLIWLKCPVLINFLFPIRLQELESKLAHTTQVLVVENVISLKELKSVLKIFFCHLAIFLVYLLATSLKFIYDKYPNPIGHGFLLWVCIFAHMVGVALWVNNRKHVIKG